MGDVQCDSITKHFYSWGFLKMGDAQVTMVDSILNHGLTTEMIWGTAPGKSENAKSGLGMPQGKSGILLDKHTCQPFY